MKLLCALVSAVVGLGVAPYLHLLIFRTPMHLPLRGIPMHCSTCGSPMKARQRNALFALATKDRFCHTCVQPLWRDSPKLEIITVAIFALVGWQLGWAWALPAYWIFFAASIAIVVVDLRLYIIPTRVVYPAVGLGIALLSLAAAINGNFTPLGTALGAMLGSWLFYFVCWFFFPSGMGFGDVRLALLIGLFTGWIAPANAVLGIFLGLLLGALSGVLLVVTGQRSRKDAIPFAPFMILGASLTIVFGGLFGTLLA